MPQLNSTKCLPYQFKLFTNTQPAFLLVVSELNNKTQFWVNFSRSIKNPSHLTMKLTTALP